MDEREAWKAEIMKYLGKAWYRRVLRLMAANVGDKGDVAKMIEWVCSHADPAEGWRDVE